MRAVTVPAMTMFALLFAAPAVAEDNHLSAGGRAGASDDSYRGVDIPHHDHDLAMVPRRATVGSGRSERSERCQTTTVRLADGGIRRIKRCRD